MTRKVLVIDDDRIIRENLSKELERSFLEPLQAANGKEGLDIIYKDKVDIVLIDVKLPDMDGLDLLKKAKETFPDIEFIVITGYGSQDIAIQALRRGAIDYIEKPIDYRQLNTAMGRALEKLREHEGLSYKDTILIIDDEKSTVARLAKFLGKEGYAVLSTFNGADGIEIIRNQKVDLVITDIKMPDIGGIDVLKRAKKLYPDIEVIMVTGHGVQELAVESLRAGAIDYLRKPINLDELLYAIRKALERIKLNRILLYRDRELKITSEIICKMNEELEMKIEERTKDLTEIQTQLFQTSKLATLGEMSAGLAHEMNQPLNGIALTAENMRKLMDRGTLTSTEIEESLQDIESSATRMSRIIDHVRTFARQDTFKFVEVDLNDVVENATSLLGEQLRLRGIEVIKEYADDLPTIKGEPYQIEQVLINILTNARDALDEEGPKNSKDYSRKITCKTGKTKDEICIAISDNGTGMTEEQKEKIFQPFFTTKEAGKATGLGMSISHGIIEKHKARVEIESVSGEGTTIKVFFPIKMTVED